MKDDMVFEEVFSSGFRVETINLDKVLVDLVKWIRTMPTHIRLIICHIRTNFIFMRKHAKLPSLIVEHFSNSMHSIHHPKFFTVV